MGEKPLSTSQQQNNPDNDPKQLSESLLEFVPIAGDPESVEDAINRANEISREILADKSGRKLDARVKRARSGTGNVETEGIYEHKDDEEPEFDLGKDTDKGT